MAKATHKLSGDGGYLTMLELENHISANNHAAISEDDEPI